MPEQIALHASKAPRDTTPLQHGTMLNVLLEVSIFGKSIYFQLSKKCINLDLLLL